MVFVEMPKTMMHALLDGGYELSLTAGSPEAQGIVSDPETMVRFRMVTHWAVEEEDVHAMVACAALAIA